MEKLCCQMNNGERTSRVKEKQDLPVVIIGAGPVGLAAAAHLSHYNQSFLLVEAGTGVGANIKTWGHIRLFSPWRYNIDKAAWRLLDEEGWREPDLDSLPTGHEIITRYLHPLSETKVINPYLLLNTKVVSISRDSQDKMKTADREQRPFVVYVEQEGEMNVLHARAVIDATGTWGNPNPANSDGVWLSGEHNISNSVFYGMPDILGQEKMRYTNKHVAVIGSGHSAINALLELAAQKELYPETSITWLIRKTRVEDTYGGEEKDALAARGELGSRIHRLVDHGIIEVKTDFKIQQMNQMEDGKVEIKGLYQGHTTVLPVFDEVIVNTGNRPDLSLLRELRTQIDSATESVGALAPLIDPNIHSCGTVRPHGEKELRQPEKNFYIVGAKSYGRAPTFLMATGYEQVRSVVAYLAGDLKTAEKVELDLPETGVCSINLVRESSCGTNSGCN
ncbi:NAD(P)-binding domain-containing protein [Priestia koreensis]|uniref:NAD(P)-binding domain-containing protein n=1 Tax=Priestia koreensis TaxID=284581 RepID=UPI00345A6D7B